MGKLKKESVTKSSRPVIAKPAPVENRPKRATKDVFYSILTTITKGTNEDIKPGSSLVKQKSTKNVLQERSPKVNNKDSLKMLKKEPEIKPEPNVIVAKKPSTKCELNDIFKKISGRVVNISSQNIFLHSVNPQLPYTCYLCSFRIENFEEFVKHVGSHVEDIRTCPECNTAEDNQQFSFEQFINHVIKTHFDLVNEKLHCNCGVYYSKNETSKIIQHFILSCPLTKKCRICRIDLENKNYGQHLMSKHIKLLNRFVCAACFLGFPTVNNFLSHICNMQYRCICELTDSYSTISMINAHINDLDEVEKRYHAVLFPTNLLRKRLFFMNPHSISPKLKPIEIGIQKFGFLESPRKIKIGDGLILQKKVLNYNKFTKNIPVICPRNYNNNQPSVRTIPPNRICSKTFTVSPLIDDSENSLTKLIKEEVAGESFTAYKSAEKHKNTDQIATSHMIKKIKMEPVEIPITHSVAVTNKNASLQRNNEEPEDIKNVSLITDEKLNDFSENSISHPESSRTEKMNVELSLNNMSMQNVVEEIVNNESLCLEEIETQKIELTIDNPPNQSMALNKSEVSSKSTSNKNYKDTQMDTDANDEIHVEHHTNLDPVVSNISQLIKQSIPLNLVTRSHNQKENVYKPYSTLPPVKPPLVELLNRHNIKRSNYIH